MILSAASLPEYVGIVGMGTSASRVRVQVPLTDKWRAGDGDALQAFEPTCEPQQSAVSYPDPHRLVRALTVCHGAAQAHFARAPFSTTASFRVVLFLCSPPRGASVVKDGLETAIGKLVDLGVEVELLMHPSAYSPAWDERTGWVWGYRPGADENDARCDDVDLGVLRDVLEPACLKYAVNQMDFVSTLSCYAEEYTGSHVSREEVEARWVACFGVARQGRNNSFPRHYTTEWNH